MVQKTQAVQVWCGFDEEGDTERTEHTYLCWKLADGENSLCCGLLKVTLFELPDSN